MRNLPRSRCPLALSNTDRLLYGQPRLDSFAARCKRLFSRQRMRTDEIAKALNVTEAEAANALRRKGERRVFNGSLLQT
jgi:predicted transcriptional regulator